jgi:beta-lactam-binding protein with PASTA domain
MSHSKQGVSHHPEKKKGFTRSFIFHLFLVFCLCVVFYLIFFSSLAGITRHGDDRKVPALTGMDARAAMKILEAQGFDVHVDSTYVPGKPALLVLDQLPDVGDIVKHGRTLFLTVNKSVPPETPMPNLVNLSFRSAELILSSNRLILGDTSYRPDIAEGAILEQIWNGKPIRPGQMIPQGSKIDLVIGDGLGNTEMNVPDVIGMSYPEAVAQLNASGLMITSIFDGDVTDTAASKVYKQIPNAISDVGAPSRIRQGDFIELYISQNPSDSVMDNNRNEWKKFMYNEPPPTSGDDSAK